MIQNVYLLKYKIGRFSKKNKASKYNVCLISLTTNVYALKNYSRNIYLPQRLTDLVKLIFFLIAFPKIQEKYITPIHN